ncbi:hypothetical protein RB653_008346 [Dictyostelium firmibasis]|uniref:Uncharacterized protein n=1 Tax=Dictyostelium firmibasis TaxID=79012 RepID=A0AAN7UCG9_9MYCE
MDVATSIQELNSNYEILIELMDTYNERIEDDNKMIQDLISRLKTTTQSNFEVEEKLQETTKQLSDFESQESSLNSEINDLKNEINTMNSQIEDYKQQIKDQEPKLDIGYILSHIFNPIGAAISDTIRFLTNNIKELSSKIDYNNNQINQKQTQINDSLRPQVLNVILNKNQLNQQKIILIEQEQSLDQVIRIWNSKN